MFTLTLSFMGHPLAGSCAALAAPLYTIDGARRTRRAPPARPEARSWERRWRAACGGAPLAPRRQPFGAYTRGAVREPRTATSVARSDTMRMATATSALFHTVAISSAGIVQALTNSQTAGIAMA